MFVLIEGSAMLSVFVDLRTLLFNMFVSKIPGQFFTSATNQNNTFDAMWRTLLK